MTSINEYRAQTARLDRAAFLGRLLWYEVPEMRLPHQACLDLMAKHGLTNTPPAPRDSNVFRRVASAAERKRMPTADESMFENYMVRNLGKAKDSVDRQIVCETVDAAGKRLAYEPLVTLEFDKATSRIRRSRVGPFNQTAEDISRTIVEEFDRWKGCLDGDAVRAVIRGEVTDMGSTSLRPGVYFVTESRVALVERLEAFAGELPGSVVVHSLDLIDDGKQREMVKRAFEAETTGEIDRLMVEIAELGDVSADQAAAYVTRWQELNDKTEEYTMLLQEKLGGASSRLKLFQRQVVALAKRAK